MRFLLNAIAVLRGTRPPENLPADRVASLLASAREAIRLGLIDQAHAALASSKWGAVRNAARLNLLGVVHELRRDWKGAKKYYGRAVRASGAGHRDRRARVPHRRGRQAGERTTPRRHHASI